MTTRPSTGPGALERRDARQGPRPLETRSCAAVDLTDTQWNRRYDLRYGRAQAVRVERERVAPKTDQTAREIVSGLTSLSAGEAGPDQPLNIVRRRWEVEN